MDFSNAVPIDRARMHTEPYAHGYGRHMSCGSFLGGIAGKLFAVAGVQKEDTVPSTNTVTRKDPDGIEIEFFNADSGRIRSDWPVTSPRGETSIATRLLSRALEEGAEVKRDMVRGCFFELEIGDASFYFHVAYNLGRIYLVASLIR
jgi:hypothetical protein